MPYSAISELPDSIKERLPKHAQEIFMAAFNSAYEQYDSEKTIFKVAWAAVKKCYRKNKAGEWVKKAN